MSPCGLVMFEFYISQETSVYYYEQTQIMIMIKLVKDLQKSLLSSWDFLHEPFLKYCLFSCACNPFSSDDEGRLWAIFFFFWRLRGKL